MEPLIVIERLLRTVDLPGRYLSETQPHLRRQCTPSPDRAFRY